MASPFENPTDRLARWALELLEYDYEIVHCKGALHHVPDTLSRAFESDTRDDENVNVLLVTVADVEIPDDTEDF